VYAILLVYLIRNLGLAPEAIGVLFSIGAVGLLVGALVANRIAGWLGVGPTIVPSAFLVGPGGLLVAIAPVDLAVPFIALGLALTGFGGVVYNINQVSLRQAITPSGMQGRMNATMRFLVWGTIPIGALIGGVLATATGLRETILLGGILGFLPVLFVLFSPVRGIGEMPIAVEAESAAGDGPAARDDSAAERLSEALDETPAPLGMGPLGRPDED